MRLFNPKHTGIFANLNICSVVCCSENLLLFYLEENNRRYEESRERQGEDDAVRILRSISLDSNV